MKKSVALMCVAVSLVGSVGCKKVAEKMMANADNAKEALESAAKAPEAKVDKLSEYIECTNSVDSRLSKNIRDYMSWSAKNGFKNGYPNMNSYSEYDQERCVKKVLAAAGTSAEPVDVSAREYAAAIGDAMNKVNEAEKYYYKTHEYKDDAYAKGKAMHPGAVTVFDRFMKVSHEFNALVDKENVARLAKQLIEVEKTEGKKFHWHEMTLMASARKLADFCDQDVIPVDAFAEAQAKFLADNDALDEYLKANVKEKPRMYSMFESAKDSFVREARELARNVKSTQGKTPKREDFIKKYNDLVSNDNRLN